MLSHNGLGEEQESGWSHHRGLGSVRTAIMVTLQITGLNHRLCESPSRSCTGSVPAGLTPNLPVGNQAPLNPQGSPLL